MEPKLPPQIPHDLTHLTLDKVDKSPKNNEKSQKAVLVAGVMRLHLQDSLNTKKKLDQVQHSQPNIPNTIKNLPDGSGQDAGILSKDKLKKRDVANESFDVDPDKEAMNRKFKQERLVLGMQVKPTKFSLLMDSLDQQSADGHSKWNERTAGCDITLCERRADHCIEQVELYRQNYFAITRERAASELQILINNAIELNDTKSPKLQNNQSTQARNKKKRTVICFDQRPSILVHQI